MKRNFLILLGLVALKFFIQFELINPVYDLHRDEYLHLDQAHHLAWGFISVPPVTSWIAYLVRILGNSVFWVKFFPALFGALTIVMVWKITETLGGKLFALILGSFAILFSVIDRINILFQPNSLEILLWACCHYYLILYLKTKNNKWLYWFAVAFAFGFLNKYNIIFLLLGLLPGLLISSERKIYLNKHFYFSVLLALLIISPNILWQIQNHFPVIHHMKLLAATQLVNINRADFLKEQMLFFLGSLFIIIGALIGLVIYSPLKKYQTFFWSFIISILLFVYFKAKGYYAIGLYPVLIAIGSFYIEHLLLFGWKRKLRIVALALPVLFFIPLLKIGFPDKTPEQIQQNSQAYKSFGLLRWEDGKDHSLPQDFADMLGWRELAQKTDSAYKVIDQPDHTVIACDNYGQAGAINYYSKIKNIQASSMNADYLNWYPLYKKITNVVKIVEADNPDSGIAELRTIFKNVQLFDSISNPFAREKGTRIYILQDAKIDINKRLEDEIAKRKLQWQ